MARTAKQKAATKKLVALNRKRGKKSSHKTRARKGKSWTQAAAKVRKGRADVRKGKREIRKGEEEIRHSKSGKAYVRRKGKWVNVSAYDRTGPHKK
jgi:hypothetical protein